MKCSWKKIIIYIFSLLLFITAIFMVTIPSYANTRMQPYVCGVTANRVWVLVECDSTEVATVDYGTTTSYGHTLTTTNIQATTGTNSYVHNIKLTALASNTTYHYRVKQGNSLSADYSFKTAVYPGTGFRFAFMADSRSNPTMLGTTSARVKAANPAFVLFGGDIASDGTHTTIKSEFFVPNMKSLMSSAPFFYSPGNHELWDQNAKAFFQGPATASTDDPDYYSFDYGDMHVLMINSILATKEGSPQYNFAQSDLAASTKPWKIVFDHYPAYCVGGEGSYANMKALSANVFKPNGVNMVLSGHSHFYQHSFADGIHHMVVGTSAVVPVTPGSDSYTIKSSKDNCYAIIDITPTTFHFVAYNDTGAVIETIDMNNSSSLTASSPEQPDNTFKFDLNANTPGYTFWKIFDSRRAGYEYLNVTGNSEKGIGTSGMLFKNIITKHTNQHVIRSLQPESVLPQTSMQKFLKKGAFAKLLF